MGHRSVHVHVIMYTTQGHCVGGELAIYSMNIYIYMYTHVYIYIYHNLLENKCNNANICIMCMTSHEHIKVYKY